MKAFSTLWSNIQQGTLFFIEENIGNLSRKEKELVYCFEECELDKFISFFPLNYTGRKQSNRLNILKTYFAKAHYNLDTTVAMRDMLINNAKLRRICGYDSIAEVPSESTLSRVFAKISKLSICGKIHDFLIEKSFKDHLIGHISRDSTAINAREKSRNNYKKDQKCKVKHKRGRPRKGEIREKVKPMIEIQATGSLEDNLLNLPKECNFGTKKSSSGKKITWKGYKLHLDVADGDIPISACLTSASVHDSQAAIPLAQMTRSRTTYCYELMDAAYDSEVIHNFAILGDVVPIIDPNPRKSSKRVLDPAAKKRYNQRSSVERVNSYLKDNYGANKIRVRGHEKILSSLMAGIVLLSVKQIAKLCDLQF